MSSAPASAATKRLHADRSALLDLAAFLNRCYEYLATYQNV